LRYRKVDSRIWNDEKFRRFSDDGKLGFFNLLTHPHMTALGAMRATVAGLAAELGWHPARLQRALQPAIDSGMVEINAAAAYVGLPNFLRYNPAAGPNSTIAWIGVLDLIPECEQKIALIARCRQYLVGQSATWRKAVQPDVWAAFGVGADHPPAMDTGEPSPHPSPIQEQEQEQEQEGTTTAAAGAAATVSLQRETVAEPELVETTEVLFRRFWDAYPRRTAKKDALKAWRALKPNAALVDEMLAAINEAKVAPEWTRDGGRYIPYPASWLRGERWRDEHRAPPALRTDVSGIVSWLARGERGENGHPESAIGLAKGALQ
jgi:hypothetical protein